nr:inositol phosphorylceramide glucuronosyltransferase 1-like [Tanacetum cinerariifolium]
MSNISFIKSHKVANGGGSGGWWWYEEEDEDGKKNKKVLHKWSLKHSCYIRFDTMKMRYGCGFLLLFLVLLAVNENVEKVSASESREAYVTLLYGDEFVLGARVLGKSIRDTRSTKDMVVLVSDGVSDYAKTLLQVFP